MELSDPMTPDTSVELNDTADRRRSGRARQKPVLLNKDPNIPHLSTTNGKRKRAESHTEDIGDISDDGDESSQGESSPNEEELKEQRRKAARSKRSNVTSAAKKVKTGHNLTTNLAVRPAINGARKAAKPKQSRARPVKDTDDAGTGLYAEIFSSGHTLDAIASHWITKWEQNNTQAMRDLVNLVIRSTGCPIEVEEQDIEDSDNVVTRLTDIQNEYQEQKIADYPLISKARGNASFRSTMTGFFDTLIRTLHASGLLYSEVTLYENLELWVSTMSSSTIRPFRHTTTVIALSMGSALCVVANDLAESAAKTTRQKEGEQKKKSVNKERVKTIEAKAADEGRKRTSIIENVQQLFDTIYLHRYRDVDPKIRVECASALGHWISALPDHFFEGTYLRYLGWVLSDTFAPTRAEIIRQLSRLFKNRDNVARLRTFTERFRARLVEISTRDSEPSVRASAVELLDTIRKTGLLEPDDIDNVGRLIFDVEPRVRKTVAGFFAENISDLLETTLEDFGGEEGLAEVLGDDVEDDYDKPKLSWLRMKCVAEALESYDAQDEEILTQRENTSGLIATGDDSRYALAAQTICDGIPEAKEWESLAGYLLHDFSDVEPASEVTDAAAFEAHCKLTEKEERLLLEILNAAVKKRLAEALEAESDKKWKKTIAQKEEAKANQEAAALHLAKVIPRLLKKFGSNPATVSAVLRLEHVLNLEIFQELRQDSTTYASLLDDINKQFLTHADRGVLNEASTALLHARSFDDLDEVTEDKLRELWDETTDTMRSLWADGITHNISSLCQTVRRIEHLASISDCTIVFDRENRASAKKTSKPVPTASPRSVLLDIIRDPALDSEAGEEADELLISVIRSLLFYHMWTARNLRDAITSKNPIESIPDYTAFSQALASIISSHHKLSSVRVSAIGSLLDLHTLFATFRHTPLPAHSTTPTDITSLVTSILPAIQPLILQSFTALEKTFAKKSRKALETLELEEDIASDPEDSDEDDEDNETSQQEALTAEKSLCELAGKMVLAIIARVLDHDDPSNTRGQIRERLQRNKTRLGSNFKEVIAYLDGPKPAKGKKKKLAAAGGAKGKKAITPAEVVEESEEESALEEGGEQDLREKELVEDRVVDPDEEDGGGDAKAGAVEEDDHDVMGD